MKPFLFLLLSCLIFVSCEEKVQGETYSIVVEKTQCTFDNQGKGTISCQATPANFDISKMTQTTTGIQFSTNDPSTLSNPAGWDGDIRILSVVKDATTDGKWTVVIGMTTTNGLPFTPKVGKYYKLNNQSAFNVTETDRVVTSNSFDLIIDINN